MASASPYWISRAASPIAWVPVAQAVTVAMLGPLAPVMMEKWPDTMLMIEAGMKKGEILRGPPSR